MTDEINTVKESITEFKNELQKRFKIPLFNYYIVTLIVFNWDIIFLLFKSEFIIEEVIKVIKNEYSSLWRIFFPFVIALFVNVSFPWITYLSEKYVLKYINIWRIDVQKSVSIKEVESLKDIQERRNETYNYKELNDQIDKLNEEKFKLLEDYEKVKSEIVELKDYHKDYSTLNSIVSFNKIYLSLIKEDKNVVSKDLTHLFNVTNSILDSKSLSKGVYSPILANIMHILIDNNLISKNENNYIYLTPKGIRFYYYFMGRGNYSN